MLRFTLRIYDTIFRALRVCILTELEVYLPTLLFLLLLRSLWMNILLVLFWWLPVGTGCGSAVDGLAPVSQTHNKSASPTLHSASPSYFAMQSPFNASSIGRNAWQAHGKLVSQHGNWHGQGLLHLQCRKGIRLHCLAYSERAGGGSSPGNQLANPSSLSSSTSQV